MTITQRRKEYHENGKLKAVYTVDENGVQQGLFRSYHENGQVHVKLKGKDGQVDDYFKLYDTEGRLRARLIMAKDNTKKFELYDEKGRVHTRYGIRFGQLNGPFELYDENGQLKLKCFYVNGKVEGILEEYKNGQLVSRSFYQDGYMHGLREFYKNGHLIKEVVYRYGYDQYSREYAIGKEENSWNYEEKFHNHTIAFGPRTITRERREREKEWYNWAVEKMQKAKLQGMAKVNPEKTPVDVVDENTPRTLACLKYHDNGMLMEKRGVDGKGPCLVFYDNGLLAATCNMESVVHAPFIWDVDGTQVDVCNSLYYHRADGRKDGKNYAVYLSAYYDNEIYNQKKPAKVVSKTVGQCILKRLFGRGGK